MNKFITLGVLLALIFINKISVSQILINEFMASNATSMDDFSDLSEFADWIELYNPSDEAYDLSDHTLSDNFNKPQKWIFRSGIEIPAKGYLKVYADGSEEAQIGYQSEYASFKLSKSGEEIALYSPAGDLIDSISYPFQYTDISYGRFPNGSDNWVYFGMSTSGTENIYQGMTDVEYTSDPVFSIAGGYFNQSVNVHLSVSDNVEIRYTLDCSKPNLNAQLYVDGLTIDSTTIVKACCFTDGKAPSNVITQSYFVSDTVHDLPIISLSAYPDVLWKQGSGIYRHSRKGKEVPANFEFFEYNKEQQVSQLLDIRLTGQASYQAPQKPFTLSAKGKYGNDIIEYPFFSNREYDQFRDIYLRTSGTPDNYYTMFRDGFTHSLVINKTDIDCQAYRPAILYLNGEYWGIYNIREKLNTDYLNNLHQVNPDNVDLLEYEYSNITEIEGKDDDYVALLDKLKGKPEYLVHPAHYDFFKSQVDVYEYMDYQMAEIYFDNVDWVFRNIKFWKEDVYTGKWRWLMLDTDVSYGMIWESYSSVSYYEHNNLSNALGSYGDANLLIRRLMVNSDFQNDFITRFSVYLNTIFSEEVASATLDSLKQGIYTEMPRQIARWIDHPFSHYGPTLKNMDDWLEKVSVMEEFALERPAYQRQHILDYFQLSGMDTVKMLVNTVGSGEIYVQNILVTNDSNLGVYFHDVSLNVKAKPSVGFKFVRWEGLINGTNPEVTISIDSAAFLMAVFEPGHEQIVPDTIFNTLVLEDNGEPYKTAGDIVIMPNAKLVLSAGTKLFMKEKASIYVYGSIDCLGSEGNPVVIDALYGNDNAWGALCFEDATQPSALKHVQFKNSSKSRNFIRHFSSISAYNTEIEINNIDISSPQQCFYSEYGKVNINNSNFHSTVSGDLVNIKYADSATVSYSSFQGSFAYDADAIDFDGLSSGVIKGNNISGFNGFNSDGIDIGEQASNILIEDNLIYRCFDKGVSVGQASTVVMRNNVIAYCDQGLGIKDFDSYARVDKNTFYSNRVGIASFEKNYGAGGGNVDVMNTIFSLSTEHAVFVDQYSQANISYSLSDTDTLLGTMNLSANPLFVNELMFDFALSENSPCIDAGNAESALDPDGSITDMGAVYTTIEYEALPIVINEINYNASADYYTGDWIELVNNADYAIDLSGWVFMDNDNQHRFNFPDGLHIDANAYLVVYGNDSSFRSRNPIITNAVGSFDFGLSSFGELIRLFDADLNLVDHVLYGVAGAWAEAPNGTGPSLELASEEVDNALAENWRSSPYLGGSPGFGNNYVPDAKYKYRILSECTGEVYFEYYPMGKIDSVLWDFGDGVESNELTTKHTYSEHGEYTISLAVYNYFGTDMSTQNVVLNNLVGVPICINDTICDSGDIKLHALSDYDVNWYSSLLNPNSFHTGSSYTDTYYSSKTFYVTGIGNDGCESARVPITAQVNIEPYAHFIFEETLGVLSLTNYSRFSNVFYWDFGDGTELNAFEPEHTFTKNGDFMVRLIAEDTFCERVDTNQKIVSVDSLSVGVDFALQNNQINVYPNPARDVLYINTSDIENEDIVIQIFNSAGLMVYSKAHEKTVINRDRKIDLQDFESGMYWLKLVHDGNAESISFVVE